MKIICNPLNLPYRYQMRGASQPACREAADPTLLEVNGQYALFPSMTAGFHTSEDLCTWTFHVLPENFPANDYAPDGCVLNGEVQLCASHGSKNGSFYRSRDPLAAPFREIPGTFPFWDPHQFVDDDGRLYFYWGCSNAQPIRGVEMDRSTMRPLGEPVPLIAGHPEQLGYERMGEDGSEENSAPWIEGAWMTKHNGRYYLQYAAPGTEFNTYADGVYESEHPLGPFVPAKNLPYSFVPDGFAQGAGHGSTLRMRNGQLFHAATMRISVNHPFERRIGLWRAGFDADGLMYCDQRYADWPMALEDAPFSPPRWMLLSHGKPVRASSGENAACAVDENIRTWWSASGNQPGEWLEVDLQASCQVNAVQINFADEGLFLEPPCPAETQEQGRYIERDPQHTRWLLEGSTDGKTYFVLSDKRRVETDLPHDLVVREAGVVCRFLRLTVQALPYGQKARISGLRVFGHAEGELPRLISSRATREGALDMLVTWEADGADGVCIQWGFAPDKLYHSCLTYAAGMRRITALCEGQRVWFRVDAFNGSGITCGEVQEVEE